MEPNVYWFSVQSVRVVNKYFQNPMMTEAVAWCHLGDSSKVRSWTEGVLIETQERSRAWTTPRWAGNCLQRAAFRVKTPSPAIPSVNSSLPPGGASAGTWNYWEPKSGRSGWRFPASFFSRNVISRAARSVSSHVLSACSAAPPSLLFSLLWHSDSNSCFVI